MNERIGVCGAGNMGKAIIQGLIQSEVYRPENILVLDISSEELDKMHNELGITAFSDEKVLAKSADILIFAVKPNVLPSVLGKIKPYLNKDQLIISIAAGVSISRIESILSDQMKIIRVMPNTPALVGEGMSALVVNQNVDEQDKLKVESIFSSFGKAEFVSESLMDSVVGLSGSGPAYVYMFVEAMADGAVQQGMSRQMAYKFAAQTVLGAAKMILETGKHPGELKDMVCSPGGTAIEAVKSLEENYFRATVMNAVIAASEKNKIM